MVARDQGILTAHSHLLAFNQLSLFKSSGDIQVLYSIGLWRFKEDYQPSPLHIDSHIYLALETTSPLVYYPLKGLDVPHTAQHPKFRRGWGWGGLWAIEFFYHVASSRYPNSLYLLSLGERHNTISPGMPVNGFWIWNRLFIFWQTCKYICECTHERVVWLSALRRACMEYGAFRPSFPEQDMSTHQLERTATSPARFTSYLRQNLSSSPLVPTYIQKLSLGNTQSPLRNYVLVPGGRYLFTALDSGKIQLWDLGPHAGVSISPEPVASMVVKDGQLLKCHGPTTDGQGLNLVVWVTYYEYVLLKAQRSRIRHIT